MEFFRYALLVAFLLSLLKLFLTKRSSKPKPKLPPGPPNLPLIGGIHHLSGGLPHQTLAALSKTYGPLMHLKLGQVHTIVASSPDTARAITHTHDAIFATHPLFFGPNITCYGGKDIVFAPYGEYWRQIRKLSVLELLSPKRVKSFRAIREQELSSFVQSIYASAASQTAINLNKGLFAMMNDITARATVGSKCGAQRTFMSFMYKAMEIAAGFNLADLFPAASGVIGVVTGMKFRIEWWHRKGEKIIEEIIMEGKERRQRRRMGDGGDGEEDLLDVLLGLQEQGDLEIRLTDESIKAILTDLLSAGSDGSTITVVWAMAELMRRPEAMKKAQREVREVFKGRTKVSEDNIDDLHYLELVVKETLRMHPTAPLLIPRQCTRKCEIDGYEIPINTRVLINVWAIGRDPRYWDEPEEFRPERFQGTSLDFQGSSNFEYIPFGAGRRMCPGIAFGLINVMMPLAHLLYYFDWRISSGGAAATADDLDMTETYGVAARKKHDLCLFAVPHIPCPEMLL